MNKKKVIIYIIILIVVSGIVGIISYNIGVNSKDINGSNSIVKERDNNNSNKDNEKKIVTQEQLAQYTTELPITIDNWKNYIELEDKEEEQKDAFGEITRIEKYTSLKMKDNNVYGYITIEYEITDKNLLEYPDYPTQTTTIYNGNSSYRYINFITDKNNNKSITKDRTFTINDMKCNRIKGKLYTIELPDDIWETNSDGKKYITIEPSEKYKQNVKGDNEYYTIHKDTYLEDLGRMVSSENMQN